MGFYQWRGGYLGEDYRNNMLIGDSLYISFKMSNYPYYIEDEEAPLATDRIRHYGIKVH